MKTPSGYSGAQIALHWAIAVLILFNYLYSEGMEDAFDARLEGTPVGNLDLNPMIHDWIGVTELALCLIRLGLRLTRGAPEAGGTGRMQQAAIWGHRLLYALMILVPLMGVITWFGRTEATADLHALLRMLLGECSAAFEALPVLQDVELLRNILYSGVWLRYDAAMKKLKIGRSAE